MRANEQRLSAATIALRANKQSPGDGFARLFAPCRDANALPRSPACEDIVKDLVANRFIPGSTVFDDRARDKLKGSKKARDLFFADIDGEDDDDDKVKAKRDELVIDLAEWLTL